MQQFTPVGTLEVRTTKEEIKNGLDYELSKTNLGYIYGRFSVTQTAPHHPGDTPKWIVIAVETKNDFLYQLKVFLTKKVPIKIEGYFAGKFFAELTINQQIHKQTIGSIFIFRNK